MLIDVVTIQLARATAGARKCPLTPPTPPPTHTHIPDLPFSHLPSQAGSLLLLLFLLF